MRAYAKLAERDDDTIHARGGTMLLAHGRPTARAVLFLHGLTASPMQCDALARRLHANGDSVIVPRLPGHGARDRLTTQLRDLRAQHLIDAAYEALAIARGLGTSVVVAGFSLGGLLAAWLAQHEHVDHAVAIAPFLGVVGIPGAGTVALATSLRTLPNAFLWWHPIKRERLMPDHGYARFPTRAIAEALGVATQLRALARTTPPATRRITLVTNESETAVNNGAARALAAAWRAHDGIAVDLHRITGLPPSHDILEALRAGTVARRAYRTLLPILHDAAQ
ncbi:MAG: alpha/beta fold hydrolase [Candidatus Eremiobacteraeota bacterium]|nr:alpha/beta fold hydrolase [Candidatus Eremiobacteraeota bacterium]